MGVPLVLLLALLAGCKTWHPSTMSPERLIVEERPSSVRVTASSGVTVTLRNPSIVNDSIVSSTEPPRPGAVVVPPRVGVPSEDVRSIEVARFSPWRTIGLVATVATISIGWARVAAESQGGPTPPPDPLPKGLSLAITSALRLVVGAGR